MFLGDIFNPFLSNAFNKSSNFTICDFFVGVNNNRSSIIALQYFLLCKQSSIAFIYDCQIDGEILNPIAFFDINIKCYQNMVRFHNIFSSFPKALENGIHPLNLN